MTESPNPARTAGWDVRRSIDDLVSDAQRYRSSADYRELVEFMARFRKQKPFNALLLHAQRPGARFVAPAHRWLEKYERQVRPGETPLVALQPFGPVMFVYDVSQTEPMGDTALPDRFANAFAMPREAGGVACRSYQHTHALLLSLEAHLTGSSSEPVAVAWSEPLRLPPISSGPRTSGCPRCPRSSAVRTGPT